MCAKGPSWQFANNNAQMTVSKHFWEPESSTKNIKREKLTASYWMSAGSSDSSSGSLPVIKMLV